MEYESMIAKLDKKLDNISWKEEERDSEDCDHILCKIMHEAREDIRRRASEEAEKNKKVKENHFDWRPYESMIKQRIYYHEKSVVALSDMIGKKAGIESSIMLHLENKVFLESLLKVGQKSLQGQARNDSTTNWNPFSNFKPY